MLLLGLISMAIGMSWLVGFWCWHRGNHLTRECRRIGVEPTLAIRLVRGLGIFLSVCTILGVLVMMAWGVARIAGVPVSL